MLVLQHLPFTKRGRVWYGTSCYPSCPVWMWLIHTHLRVLTHVLCWQANHYTWPPCSPFSACLPGEYGCGLYLHIAITNLGEIITRVLCIKCCFMVQDISGILDFIVQFLPLISYTMNRKRLKKTECRHSKDINCSWKQHCMLQYFLNMFIILSKNRYIFTGDVP